MLLRKDEEYYMNTASQEEYELWMKNQKTTSLFSSYGRVQIIPFVMTRENQLEVLLIEQKGRNTRGKYGLPSLLLHRNEEFNAGFERLFLSVFGPEVPTAFLQFLHIANVETSREDGLFYTTTSKYVFLGSYAKARFKMFCVH